MPGRQASCGLAAQVKTRLQSEGKHTAADRRYAGSADAVQRIWQTEGALRMAKAAMIVFYIQHHTLKSHSSRLLWRRMLMLPGTCTAKSLTLRHPVEGLRQPLALMGHGPGA